MKLRSSTLESVHYRGAQTQQRRRNAVEHVLWWGELQQLRWARRDATAIAAAAATPHCYKRDTYIDGGGGGGRR